MHSDEGLHIIIRSFGPICQIKLFQLHRASNCQSCMHQGLCVLAIYSCVVHGIATFLDDVMAAIFRISIEWSWNIVCWFAILYAGGGSALPRLN